MQIDRPISIALIIFITIVVSFFLLVPQYQLFGKLQTQLAEKKAEFNAEYDYYSAISKTYFDIQSRKDDIGKIDEALSEQANLGQLIYYLQKTASANGLLVKDLFASKTGATVNSATAVKDITLSVDLLGTYSSLGSFITALEKSSRLFEISNISFGSGMSKAALQTQDAYSFNLQIKTHSY